MDRSTLPLITIGIPVFNGAATIERSISSVQAQTWGGPLEILVVDDGSTDRTPTILEALRAADPQIKIIRHNKNLGRPAARNTILNNASGEFLAWLDADDEWHREKLEYQMEAFAAQREVFGNDVITMCPFEWRWSGRQKGRLVNPRITDDNLRDFLSGDLGAYLWSMLGPTETFTRTGSFDEKLPRLQDLDFMIRFAERGGKVITTRKNIPLCIYHKTDDSKSGRAVKDSLDHIWNKHRTSFEKYGKKFSLSCRRKHTKLIARHSLANREILYGTYHKILSVLLKIQLLLDSVDRKWIRRKNENLTSSDMKLGDSTEKVSNLTMIRPPPE